MKTKTCLLISLTFMVLFSGCYKKNVLSPDQTTMPDTISNALIDSSFIENGIDETVVMQPNSRSWSTTRDGDFGPAPTQQPDNQQQKGSFVYYCPSRMLENTCNNVSVTISKEAIDMAIMQLKKKMVSATGKTAESIQGDIHGSLVKLAQKMKVELKYGSNDFELVHQPEYKDQVFDGTNELNWDWIVKPTRVGMMQLSIIISAYDEKNGRWVEAQTPPKIFNINVSVDPRGYFAKLWSFFCSNPEWLLTQIIFPIIAFFLGKRVKKNKQKKT